MIWETAQTNFLQTLNFKIMKTFNFKCTLLLMALLCSTMAIAQHTSIEHNSTGTDPHLELEETESNDFSRLFFTNSTSTDKWSLAGAVGSAVPNKYFGFYYNGSPRVVYNEVSGGLGIGLPDGFNSKLAIKANSGNSATRAQIEVRESDSGYGRIMYSNTREGQWVLAGRCENDANASNSRFNIYYSPDGVLGNGTNILSVNGGDYRVGVNETNPAGALHVKQNNLDQGLILERNGAFTDEWGLRNVGSLVFNLNGTNMSYISSADGTYNLWSDARVKNNVELIEDGVLDLLMQLKPKSYFYNHENNPTVRSIGYLAQELQNVFPEAVSKFPEEDKYAVNYTKMGVYTVKAVQEVYKEVKDLRTKNEEMNIELQRLSQLVDQLISEK